MLTPKQLEEIRSRRYEYRGQVWFECHEDADLRLQAMHDKDALFNHIDSLAAQVAELRRALEMAADTLADVGVGGQILYRSVDDEPDKRASRALQVAEAALSRDSGEAVRRVEVLEQEAERRNRCIQAATQIGEEMTPWVD